MATKRIPLIGLEAAIQTKTPEMIREMADELEQRMYDNVSLEDHTLKELNLLGNPYGKKHPQEIHNPAYLVHTQHSPSSGNKIGSDLIDALRVNIVNQYRIQVGFDESIAPHVRDVYWGTTKATGMRGRDFIEGSFQEVQEEFKEIGENGLKEIVEKGAIGGTPEFR